MSLKSTGEKTNQSLLLPDLDGRVVKEGIMTYLASLVLNVMFYFRWTCYDFIGSCGNHKSCWPNWPFVDALGSWEQVMSMALRWGGRLRELVWHVGMDYKEYWGSIVALSFFVTVAHLLLKEKNPLKTRIKREDVRNVVFFLLIWALTLIVYNAIPLILQPTHSTIMTDCLPRSDCFYPVYPLTCSRGFTFKPEDNSLELSIRNHQYEERDFVITELSLIQVLPVQKMFCWLNASEIPPESLYSNPSGLHIRPAQIVKVKLDCTPFEYEDIEKGVWLFNQTTYVVEDENLSPAQLFAEMVIDSDMSLEGYIHINYVPCGRNEIGWCETTPYK